MLAADKVKKLENELATQPVLAGPPPEFLCADTGQLMTLPVLAPDGKSYQLEEGLKHFPLAPAAPAPPPPKKLGKTPGASPYMGSTQASTPGFSPYRAPVVNSPLAAIPGGAPSPEDLAPTELKAAEAYKEIKGSKLRPNYDLRNLILHYLKKKETLTTSIIQSNLEIKQLREENQILSTGLVERGRKIWSLHQQMEVAPSAVAETAAFSALQKKLVEGRLADLKKMDKEALKKWKDKPHHTTGQTLLHMLAAQGDLPSIQWLADKNKLKASLWQTDALSGMTPLVYAAQFGHLTVVGYLLAYDLQDHSAAREKIVLLKKMLAMKAIHTQPGLVKCLEEHMIELELADVEFQVHQGPKDQGEENIDLPEMRCTISFGPLSNAATTTVGMSYDYKSISTHIINRRKEVRAICADKTARGVQLAKKKDLNLRDPRTFEILESKEQIVSLKKKMVAVITDQVMLIPNRNLQQITTVYLQNRGYPQLSHQENQAKLNQHYLQFERLKKQVLTDKQEEQATEIAQLSHLPAKKTASDKDSKDDSQLALIAAGKQQFLQDKNAKETRQQAQAAAAEIQVPTMPPLPAPASASQLPIIPFAQLTKLNRDLHSACRDENKTDKGRKVRSLLEAKATPHFRDAGGQSPLFWSTVNGNPTNVQILLEANAEPNDSNLQGLTLLHAAATFCKNLQVVQLLLDAKANVNATSPKDGSTPLHQVAGHEGDPVDFVKLLLAHKAIINALFIYGNSQIAPMQLAYERKNSQCLQELRAASDAFKRSRGRESEVGRYHFGTRDNEAQDAWFTDLPSTGGKNVFLVKREGRQEPETDPRTTTASALLAPASGSVFSQSRASSSTSSSSHTTSSIPTAKTL